MSDMKSRDAVGTFQNRLLTEWRLGRKFSIDTGYSLESFIQRMNRQFAVPTDRLRVACCRLNPNVEVDAVLNHGQTGR